MFFPFERASPARESDLQASERLITPYARPVCTLCGVVPGSGLVEVSHGKEKGNGSIPLQDFPAQARLVSRGLLCAQYVPKRVGSAALMQVRARSRQV